MKTLNLKAKTHIVIYIIFSNLLTAVMLYQPIILKNIFDDAKNYSNIMRNIIILGTTIVLILLLDYVNQYSIAKIRYILKNDLSSEVFKSLTGPEYIDLKNDVVSEYNVDLNSNIDSLIEEYYMVIITVISTSTSLVLYIVTIFKINFSMLIIMVLTNLITIVMPVLFDKNIKVLRKDVLVTKTKLNSVFQDFISGSNIIKNLFAMDKWLGNVQKYKLNYTDSELNFRKYRVKTNILLGLASYGGWFILVFYGAYSVYNSVLTVGEFIACFQISEMIITPMRGLAYSLSSLSGGKQIRNNFEKRYSKTINALKYEPQVFSSIRFSNVAVGFENNLLYTIEDLSINKGDKIIITGENGTGKSTFTNILTRRFNSYEGNVYIDDINLKDTDFNKINSLFNILEQTDYIFNLSFKEDMELFSDKITRNRFYDLVKSGNLENTENCRTLSGGEKQRLSFLRSINFDKRILIMDESFNMVQNDMKKEILKTINEDSELTVVYISHDHSDYMSGFTRIFEFSNKKVNVRNVR